MNPLTPIQTLACLLRHPVRREDLSAYLDDRLAPPQRSRVDEHLAACDRCRRELEDLRAVVRALRGLPQAPVPRSFRLSPAQVETARPAARPTWAYGALGTATAAATILFVALLSGDLLTLERAEEEEAKAPVVATAPAALMGRQDQEAAEAGEALPAEEDRAAEEAPPPQPTLEAAPPAATPPATEAPPEASAPAVPTQPPEAEEAERPAPTEDEDGGIGRVALRVGEAAAAALALAALGGLLVLRRRRART